MTKEEGVLRTLIYSDLFGYPLGSEEIYSYYSGPPPLDFEGLLFLLFSLVKKGRVCFDRNTSWYYLAGREDTLQIRLKRNSSSRAAFQRAERLARVVSLLPWVKLVGLTGSLAVGDYENGDDIDLMVVTSPGRLWLGRFLIFLFLKIFRLKSGPGRFCVNVWMDVSHLSVENDQQDLVVARDIAQMRVLFDKGGVYGRLLADNFWLDNYLPLFRMNRQQQGRGSVSFESASVQMGSRIPRLISRFLNYLDGLLFEGQRALLRRNHPGSKTVLVSRFRLWQHPNSQKDYYIAQFEKRCIQYSLPTRNLGA